jgi:5'-nucleotidase
MMKIPTRPLRLGLLAAALALAGCTTPPPATVNPAPTVDINLVALNDFHGNLEASRYKYKSYPDLQEHTVVAGGADVVAGALQAWRKEDSELVLVGAGDLIGASPAMSSMWADEPTIGAMNLLGLRVTSVGNHEFDQGRFELLRQQNGGCDSPRPDKACKYTPTYDGAKFSYLAANVIDSKTGKPFMPAYRIEQAHGVKIGFIGAVLEGTASVALASGIAGLQFGDEADAINRVLPELRAQGVGVFVVLIHQGGHTDSAPQQPDCSDLKGDIVDVVKRLDPAIRLVVSGHSHTGYLCRVDGRLVTQADMGGHLMSRIKLKVDPVTNTVREVSASNVLITADAFPADPAMSAYLQAVRARSTAQLTLPVARLAVQTVSKTVEDNGESPLGDVVADSTLYGARAEGAQIGFMNNGGMRKDLDAGSDLVTNQGQARAVLPFGNSLVVMDLTGDQIRALLEQQWQDEEAEERGLLQVSTGFSYRWNGKRQPGHRVVPGSIRLNGVRLAPAKTYRVSMNNFLAEGGDKFSMFAEGIRRKPTGVRDIDAFIAYLAQRQKEGKPAGAVASAGRIVRVK